MRIFTSTTFTWWELGMLKWSGFCVGIAVGATWSPVFSTHTITLVVIGLLLAVCPAVAYFKQK